MRIICKTLNVRRRAAVREILNIQPTTAIAVGNPHHVPALWEAQPEMQRCCLEFIIIPCLKQKQSPHHL